MHEAVRWLDGDASYVWLLFEARVSLFCSGADLKQDRTSSQDTMLGSKHGATMYDALMHMNPVTIALCHGYMIGGGAVLPAACDFKSEVRR